MNWLLLGVLILALGLRLPLINGSFWLDEAAQALESIRPLNQQFDIIPDFQPPLMHVLVHFATYFSVSEWWLRLVGALIPGLLTVWLTFKIGEERLGRGVGVLASLLLATSSFHIFFSQELRPYALPAAIGIASWWVLLRLASAQAKTDQERHSWWVYGVLTALGLYSSYLYPFLIIGQLLWVGWSYRQHWLKFGLSLAGAGVAFLPIVPLFLKQLTAGGQVRQDLPGWEAVVSIPQLKSLPLVAAKFTFGVLDSELNLLFLGVMGLIVVLAVLALKSMPLKTAKNLWTEHSWLIIGLVIPLLTAWLVSFWIPVVQPKRVLYLLPLWYLFFSWISLNAKSRWLGLVLGGILLSINLWSTSQYFLNPQYQREDWRDAYQTIAQRYDVAHTIAVFQFQEPFAPWRWYDHAEYPTLSTGTLHISQVQNVSEQLKSITQYEYVIVFDYLSDLTDPQRQLLQEIEAYGYETIDLLEYPNLGFVRIYAKKGAASA